VNFKELAEQAMNGRVQEDGDCLIWTGRLSCSSGHPKYKDHVVRRVVWQAEHGPLTPKQLVTTTCGNPKCLEHLALTNKSKIAKKTNADPRVKAIKQLKSTAHSRRTAKLSVEKAREIRNSELGNKELADLYGVSHGLISKVRTNKAWLESYSSPFSGLGARA
jgi:hypothetical protein